MSRSLLTVDRDSPRGNPIGDHVSYLFGMPRKPFPSCRNNVAFEPDTGMNGNSEKKGGDTIQTVRGAQMRSGEGFGEAFPSSSVHGFIFLRLRIPVHPASGRDVARRSKT